jgi:hypothetical protein
MEYFASKELTRLGRLLLETARGSDRLAADPHALVEAEETLLTIKSVGEASAMAGAFNRMTMRVWNETP